MGQLRKWWTIIGLLIAQLTFGQVSSDEFFKKGVANLDNADYKAALTDFQKSLELNQDEKGLVDIHDCLAFCYYKLNEFKKSLDHVDKVLQLDRNNVSVRLTRAWTFQEQNDNSRALAEYDTLTSITKDNWLIYMGRGTLYNSMGQKKLAIKDFERVKEIALKNGDKGLYESTDMSIQRLKKKR